MSIAIFLFSLVMFILSSPSIFYAQSWSDKSRMQQQSDQIRAKYDNLKNEFQPNPQSAAPQFQVNSQGVAPQFQEVEQEGQAGAVKYQEKYEQAVDTFDKAAKKSQALSINSIIRLYAGPLLIIAAIGFIFLVIWFLSI